MGKNKYYGYILGQLTALVSELIPEAPEDLFALVMTNPSKLDPWLVELLKKEVADATEASEMNSEIMELADLYYDLKSGHKVFNMKDKNDYSIGYYHQKAQHSVIPTRKRIGQQVKESREKNGLSLRQLADMTGLSYNHICQIEAGKYGVSVDSLSKLGTALGWKLKLG